MKKITIPIISILLIIVCLYFVQYFIDSSKYGMRILSTLSHKSNLEISINSINKETSTDVINNAVTKFTLFPYLTLNLRSINIKYNGNDIANIKNAEVKIALIKLMYQKDLMKCISSIKLQGGEIYIQNIMQYYHDNQKTVNNTTIHNLRIKNHHILNNNQDNNQNINQNTDILKYNVLFKEILQITQIEIIDFDFISENENFEDRNKKQKLLNIQNAVLQLSNTGIKLISKVLYNDIISEVKFDLQDINFVNFLQNDAKNYNKNHDNLKNKNYNKFGNEKNIKNDIKNDDIKNDDIENGKIVTKNNNIKNDSVMNLLITGVDFDLNIISHDFNINNLSSFNAECDLKIKNLNFFITRFLLKKYLKNYNFKIDAFIDSQIPLTSQISMTNGILTIFDFNTNSEVFSNLDCSILIDLNQYSQADIEINIDKIDLSRLVENNTLTSDQTIQIVDVLAKFMTDDYSFSHKNEYDTMLISFRLKINEIFFHNNSINLLIIDIDQILSNIFINKCNFFVSDLQNVILKSYINGTFKNTNTTHNINKNFDGNVIISSQDLYGLISLFKKYINNHNDNSHNIININTQIVDDEIHNDINEQRKEKQNGIFQSEVFILPHIIKFNNFQTKIINTAANGVASFIFTDHIHNNVESRIKVKGDILNLDALSFNLAFDNYLYYLYNVDSLNRSSGFIHNKGYDWLRFWNSELYVDLEFEKVIFKTKEFQDLYSSIQINQNNFAIKNLGISSDILCGDSAFNLSILNLRPYINFDAMFNYIDLDQIYKFLPNFKDIKQKQHSAELANLNINQINNQINDKENNPINQSTQQFQVNSIDKVDKTDIIEKQIENSNINTDNNNFNFLSLSTLNGEINLEFDKVISFNTEAENVYLEMKLNNGIISLEMKQGNIFGGTLQFVGQAMISDLLPQFNISVSGVNLSSKKMSKIFPDLNFIDGYTSLIFYLKTYGSNLNDSIIRANGTMNFILKSTYISGFGLDEIINTVDYPNWPVEYKIERIKYYTNYGQTYFEDVKGSADIQDNMLSIKDCQMTSKRATGAMAINYILSNQKYAMNSYFSFIPSGYNKSMPIMVKMNRGINDNNAATNVAISKDGNKNTQIKTKSDDTKTTKTINVDKIIEFVNTNTHNLSNSANIESSENKFKNDKLNDNGQIIPLRNNY